VPWYDYRCEECSGTFEARMPVERRDEAACPACGSRRVKRALPLRVTVLAGAGSAAEDDGCCGGECGPGEGCACAGDDELD
jgi:putative FmdB family regulatory protein